MTRNQVNVAFSSDHVLSHGSFAQANHMLHRTYPDIVTIAEGAIGKEVALND